MFDDEEAGAIDTGDVNESAGMDTGAPTPSAPISGDNLDRGAIPEDESAGLNTAAPQAPAPDRGNTPTSGLLADAQNSKLSKGVAGGVKSIVSYLMGADAMPPQAIDGAGKTVDPRGELNPSQRNLLAIQHARENGGDEAAWALMQSNRVAYNAQTAFGKAALQGTGQKPPDLRAAIDAANKAQANVLDGTNVEFKPLQGGTAVTATVTGPDGQPQQIVLSPQQFGKWLDVGGDGQWDKVMSTSAVATLQKLAAEGPSRGAKTMAEAGTPTRAQPRSLPAAPSESDSYEPEKIKTTYGTAAAPSTINLSGSDEAGDAQPDLTGYDPKMKARAFEMFPGVGDTQQRGAFMNADEQRQAALDNSVKVAAEKGANDIAKAKVAGGAKVEAAGIYADASKFKASQMGEAQKAKVMQELQRQERIAASTASRNAASLLRQKLANNLFDKMSPEENEQVKSMIGAGQPGAAPPHAPAPQQQGGAPAPQGQASPARAQLSDGKYYIRGPDGKAKVDPNQNP